jgi:TonB-linked SusC/RagA family outer membrane protein
MQFSFAQEKTVTGVVSDKTGPIPGANVVVKGTTRSAQTDFDGKYSIKAKAGEVLLISFVGMTEQSVTIGAGSNYNVNLDNGVKLEEVIVQGYRSISKGSAVTSVAKVDSKTIENRPNANVINTLQGQLAGVNISANTGQPGAKSSVIIRGIGSINANSDPLYVIDGFPSNSDNFRSINPNDIESVQVLKDAAAVSEFGSRGTNGVIVIKTRTGSFGEAKTTFRYSSQYGLTELQTPKYNYANSRQLLALEKEYGQGGLGTTLTDAEIAAYNINTDWVDIFFRIGQSSNHNFSIENSGKNINSFTSVSYFKQDGVLETTGLQRFTVRNNLSGKSNNGKFSYYMNVGIGFSKTNEDPSVGTTGVNRNYILGAYLGLPYLDPNRYEGSVWTYDEYNATPGLSATPYMLMDKLVTYRNLVEETRINVAAQADYKLTDALTARVRTSGESLTTFRNQVEFPNSFNALLFSNTPGIASFDGGAFNGFEDINNRRDFIFNNLYQIDYTKKFGKHKIGINVNSEFNFQTFQADNQRQRGLNPQTFVPNTGTGYIADTAANDWYVPSISAGRSKVTYISYFGSFDYDYAEKFGLVATLRRDKVSYFDSNNQAKDFWSVGARWNIDKESFMDNSVFNKLKLRGSIGTVGNSRIVDGSVFAPLTPPRYLDVYAPANNVYNGGLGYSISFGFPPLRWEYTKQWNVGFDFELFKGRLRGTYDYYNRETFDMYLNQPVTNTSGTSGLNLNSDATLTNFGHEIQLAYDLVNSSDFKFTIRGNAAKNTNEVNGILSNNGRINNGTVNIFQNGGLYNEYYTIPYVGVNPANGNLLFLDINGNQTETVTAADQRATGKSFQPKWQGGFGFDLDYKGFFASSTFTFVTSVYRFDSDYESLLDPTNLSQFTVATELTNAWTSTNTSSNIPSLTASNLGSDDLSDRFLRDASYIRLRNLQLGYRVPKKFLNKTFISDLSFTLQGENLFTWTKWQGFDAEASRVEDLYQYPTPKIYTFGVDIKF